MVDDDANLREIIKAKLEAVGFVVIEARDGEDGVNKAKNNKPDLILMDVQMPKMNGIEALSKIKADPDTSQARYFFLLIMARLIHPMHRLMINLLEILVLSVIFERPMISIK